MTSPTRGERRRSRPHLEQSIGSALAGHPALSTDAYAALRAYADDARLDPDDRAGRNLPIRPLPEDLLTLSSLTRRVMLGTPRAMEGAEIAERVARIVGVTRAARARHDVTRLLSSRPHMFARREGAFRLVGAPPPARPRWFLQPPTDELAIPQLAGLEPGTWLAAAQALARRIDAEPTTTARFVLWDRDYRAPQLEFSLSVFYDDTPGAAGAVACVVALTCVAGSQLVDLLTAAGWRWRPAHVADPSATSFERHFLDDPDNLVTLEVGAASTRAAAEAVLATARGHLGVDDVDRVSVQLEPMDPDRAAAVREHLRCLAAAFDPPSGPGGGGSGGVARPTAKVLATCVVCGRDLTDPASAGRRIGDDCRRRVLDHATNLRLDAPGDDLVGYIDRVATSRQPQHLWARAVPAAQWAASAHDDVRRRLSVR